MRTQKLYILTIHANDEVKGTFYRHNDCQLYREIKYQFKYNAYCKDDTFNIKVYVRNENGEDVLIKDLKKDAKGKIRNSIKSNKPRKPRAKRGTAKKKGAMPTIVNNLKEINDGFDLVRAEA